jgi:NADPH:quinone reductase-like Zn-dependent oxidoreductase
VFGLSGEGAAQAELAVLSSYAPIPPSLDFPGAAALPAAIETATRALDQLGVGGGRTLLINGASGSVGSAAVQLAGVRGARVIGTGSPANHEYLRSLGPSPSPTARASSGGFARSRPTVSRWRSTSLAAAFCPSSSSSRAARSTS